MTPEQLIQIKEYVTKFDSNIQNSDQLDLIVETVVDRVLLYLNEIALETRLERIVAQIVVAAFKDNGVTHDQTIASVEDNGQVVRYHQAAVNYFATASDSEIFSGFTKLLAPYRRIHVINTEL